MCRILYAQATTPFSISHLLQSFAEMARDSREFQGHGWGCAWRDADGDTSDWQQYHNIRPVWEDDLNQFGSTHLLLVHARSSHTSMSTKERLFTLSEFRGHIFIFFVGS